MKKRNLFVALMMAIVMIISGCGVGTENKFIGTWTGTLDMTDYIVQSIVAQDENLEKYAEFEDLSFTLVFEFTEENISLHLEEASTTKYIENITVGVERMIDAMVAELATTNDMTEEDIYAGMGVTRDAYIQSVVDSMKLETAVSEMAEALALKGTYKYDGEKIVVIYEDDTYEEMQYSFEGETLVITVSDGNTEHAIECKKTK